jgi:Mrp family chromosome partitioning ATPase
MSAIDQAFIRAYEIDEVGHASSPRATAKAPQRVAPIQPSTVVEKIAVQAAVEAAVAQPQVKPVAVQARSVAHSPPPAATAVPSSSIVAEPPAERPSVEPARTSQRRPLSTFAQPTQVVEARFKPALEVDSFRWSAVTEQLIRRCGAQLQPAVATLLAAQVGGTGCTTLVACLARLLVDAGKTVAIVDANFAKPGLASQLGLAAETGWEDVLSGRVSLAEAVVHSIGDRLSLLPLAIGGPAAASRLETIHASVTAGVLRYHYDIVLFDLGVVADPQQGPIARRVIQQCRLDGALVASGRGAAAAQPQQLLRSAPELATICLGVVENQLRAA